MKKILFFVNGFAPTGEDMKDAAKIEGQVLFRNVQLFDENEPLEKCDGVMGLVPEPYAEKYKVKQPKFEKKESE
jgi:hypothetical protein